MALLMLAGPLTVFLIPEPESKVDRASLLQEERVIAYMANSGRCRPGSKTSSVGSTAPWLSVPGFLPPHRLVPLVILLFIGIYKLSDVIMGVMASPFYIDAGFSKTDIANVTKLYGFIMSVVGGLIGGLLVARWGVVKPLIVGAALVGLPNLLFAWLAYRGIDQVSSPFRRRNGPCLCPPEAPRISGCWRSPSAAIISAAGSPARCSSATSPA